jgi:hypothetical protein
MGWVFGVVVLLPPTGAAGMNWFVEKVGVEESQLVEVPWVWSAGGEHLQTESCFPSRDRLSGQRLSNVAVERRGMYARRIAI